MANTAIKEKIENAWQEKCHAQFEQGHEKCVYLSTRELQLLQKRGVSVPIYWINKEETLAYIKVDFDKLIQLAQ